ncbi:MAG: potassium-transporting ATPase subunit KdpA [Armatimonadetes bacterium]|nr:potassium-transporting ATPase subunit KdpA [Armatimonadota bacterium]MBX3108737.1 potassium-transporting ATPase subunit KdpA [Fimbriimonadaceae bacterium]
MSGWIQIAVYLAVLIGLSFPLGRFMAKVFDGERHLLSKVFGWLERLVLRVGGVDATEEQGWKRYAWSVIAFNLLGAVAVFGLQRLQAVLPVNPDAMRSVSADSAFNTAMSFATNTNWQGYGGESTMSYFTQMLGLGVQNFLSAATGMAVLVALIRGLRAKEAATIGNFWVDMTRATVYVLLPLSVVLAMALVGQGVVQTFDPAVKTVAGQVIALGPAASQIAIKQLGTNGGGFFNVNSAHPFENPTGLSNFLECLAILLIPAALCITFGEMVKDRRQGWAVLAAMSALLLMFLVPTVLAEQHGNPAFKDLGLASTANWEGKEARFGIENSALWAVATTAASNGSVNSMHDSYSPVGGMLPMLLIQLGEVVFGGVGSGLYGMLVFAIIAVFIAGLMVGRTPEYLGKKISPYEMKMASLVILIPCAVVLIGTAAALMNGAGQTGMANPGAHGFSELLYAYSSMGNNNGSAFAGFGANLPFHNYVGGAIMWISRFWLIVPVLALAGSLAKKRVTPSGPGTLPTHTPLFVCLLCGTVLIVGALTFIPALALGPVVEQIQMHGAR